MNESINRSGENPEYQRESKIDEVESQDSENDSDFNVILSEDGTRRLEKKPEKVRLNPGSDYTNKRSGEIGYNPDTETEGAVNDFDVKGSRTIAQNILTLGKNSENTESISSERIGPDGENLPPLDEEQEGALSKAIAVATGKSMPGKTVRGMVAAGVIGVASMNNGKVEEGVDVNELLEPENPNTETVPYQENKAPEELVVKTETQEETAVAFEEAVLDKLSEIDPVDIKLTKERAADTIDGVSVVGIIQENFKLDEWNEETGEGVPQVVAEELRNYYIKAVCAKETRFDASRVSKVGAVSILQITPENWEFHGGKKEEYTSVSKGAEISGKHFSYLYKQLMDRLGDGTVSVLQDYFGNSDSFQRNFITPLLISSYQTGPGRAAEATKLFLADNLLEKFSPSKDLFLAIIDRAKDSKEGKYQSGFGTASHGYVLEVEAWAKILNEEKA